MEGERHNYVGLTKEHSPKTFAGAPMTVLTVDYDEKTAGDDIVRESDVWDGWDELDESKRNWLA